MVLLLMMNMLTIMTMMMILMMILDDDTDDDNIYIIIYLNKIPKTSFKWVPDLGTSPNLIGGSQSYFVFQF